MQNRQSKTPPPRPTAERSHTSESADRIAAAQAANHHHKDDAIIDLEEEEVLVPPGMEDLSTTRVLFVGGVLLAFGTLGFYWIEGLVDKGVEHNLVNAFYCAAITLTT